MFIKVIYGANRSLLFNPYCAVINLLGNIKLRCGEDLKQFLKDGEQNVLDLADESGLVRELNNHYSDYATKHLESPGTYILVQRQDTEMTTIQETSKITTGSHSANTHSSESGSPVFQYLPLLEKYEELFPNISLHVANQMVQSRSARSKSGSAKGRKKLKRRQSTISKVAH